VGDIKQEDLITKKNQEKVILPWIKNMNKDSPWAKFKGCFYKKKLRYFPTLAEKIIKQGSP